MREDRSSGGLPLSTQTATLPKHQDDVPRGILFMIGASVLFALANAIAKWQVAIYPVGEVMFFRSFVSLVACAAVILPFNGIAVFATQRPRDHIARGLSQSISQTCTVIAFWLMPLAGAIAIIFSAPLFAALLSIIFLKERAGAARWTALLAGFFGVLVVTNPGWDSVTVGALFALANAVMYGSVTVAVRGMTKTESTNTLLMWQMLTIAICHSFLLLFGFRWPTTADAAHVRPQRRRLGGGAISMDAGAVAGADNGGVAVLLSVAGMGDGDRLPRVGRGAVDRATGRVGYRRGVRTVPALARGPASAAG